MDDQYMSDATREFVEPPSKQATVGNIMAVATAINQFNALFWFLKRVEDSSTQGAVIQIQRVGHQEAPLFLHSDVVSEALKGRFKALGDELLANNVDVDSHVNDLIAAYHEQKGTGI